MHHRRKKYLSRTPPLKPCTRRRIVLEQRDSARFSIDFYFALRADNNDGGGGGGGGGGDDDDDPLNLIDMKFAPSLSYLSLMLSKGELAPDHPKFDGFDLGTEQAKITVVKSDTRLRE